MRGQLLRDFLVKHKANLDSEVQVDFFECLSDACIILSAAVNKAGLLDILGAKDSTNASGEQQQKLDLLANQEILKAFSDGKLLSGFGSEENEDFVPIPADDPEKARYVLLTDPLDGSANIDVNSSIGTIFTLYERQNPGGKLELEDFLQPGTKQLAAGYVLYGTSTMLVFTCGNGVNGFTLDPEKGSFFLSHPDMKIPATGKIYSINEGNRQDLDQGLRSYLDWCQQTDADTKRPYTARYIGAMVADFHRNLLKGGIFMYPGSGKYPDGKLRLLYECNPLAFVVEQAGGKATNGSQRILDLKPSGLHQRTPVFIGSSEMVERVEAFLRQETSV